ncbi:MAG: inorganic phosphate transporter [candidate division KSB1 bacterium]|nr:inorganic phosphate transporter [candidate division KSB1 bacterium]
MSLSVLEVVIIIILAWIYDFFNGMNDAANAIATTVSTRALTPRQAILLAQIFNVIGAFMTTAVARTIGKGIVRPEAIDQVVVVAALIGASSWSALCTFAGIPISITHALVAGIMGGTIFAKGVGVLQWAGIQKVIIAMFLSPLAGFLAGFLMMVSILWLFRRMLPSKINRWFRYGQILSASFVAFTHGSNDAQNAMGIITASLVIGGFLDSFHVPFWVILGSAGFMGLGTAVGGWKVIRTMGMKMVKLKPVHGFSAECSTSLVVLIATLLGAPISTTHVISTSIMGVGATRRLSAVRWGVARHIVLTWIFTFPGAALIAGIMYVLISLVASFV